LNKRKEFLQQSLEVDDLRALFNENYDFLSDGITIIESFIDSYRIVDDKFVTSNKFYELNSKNRKEIQEISKQLEPFIKNIKIKEDIERIEKVIAEDKGKKQSIIRLKKEINSNKEQLSKEKENVFKLYQDNILEYSKIIERLSERTKLLTEQKLQIIGSTKFNSDKFKKSLLAISDGRSSPERVYNILSPVKNLIDFSNDDLDEIKNIFDSIVEEKYSLTSRTDRKHAIKVLLDDYFLDHWDTVFDGDKMGEMSTGKASFVILMLIVGLSKEKAPILIDQPEDNLDNRSITKDLVEYLRDKKTDRQIILVTHNPNVVVNADAENVIVANQKGQNDKETSSLYKFDYINGPIENTFGVDHNEEDLLISMGIREHIAEIVEGGKEAFKKREKKYGFLGNNF
jgi:ABC-type lipoprotein export system ATPase subunit